jgi:type IV pilus assembly protein PilB
MEDRRRLAVVGADLATKMLVLEACSGAFDVEPMESRPDLLTQLRSRPPSVLLLDAEMPHLDAFDVLSQIHKVPELKATITLFLVPPEEMDRVQEARKLGASDVAGKPLDADDLKACIEGALARHREASQGRTRLGTLLMNAGVLTPGQLDTTLATQAEEGGRLGAICIREGFCSELDLANSLAVQMHIPFVDLQAKTPAPSVLSMLPREFIMRNRVLPLELDDRDHLVLAMTNPLDVVAIDEAALRSGKRVLPAICTESDFDEAVIIHFSTRGRLQAGEQATAVEAETEVDEGIIRLVDGLISDADSMKASDLHLEPTADGLRVRCRIDGIMHDLRQIGASLAPGVVSRLKIMGSMDIAERRLPQDGRVSFQTTSGKQLDLRLASVPSLHGENVSVRLLEVDTIIPTLDDLGLRGPARTRYEDAVANSKGGIIICGPTGSGKSTSLYATLQSINDSERKIYTVEDPIERSIPGIVQTEVREQIGLTFSRALRSLVRADPDVIMVGEIRDLETARMAADSAVTGHLVFTTIHANDGPATLFRLVDMGLPRYVVAAAFRCVVAQRLIRRLCPWCKRNVAMSAASWEQLGLGPAPSPKVMVSEPVGCGRCFGTGYLGRVGIFEILSMDEEISEAVTSGVATDVRRLATERGVETLQQDGVAKVLSGVTSYLELIRVTA